MDAAPDVTPSVGTPDPSRESGTGQTQTSLAFLSGGGELGAMVRAYDWSKTSLGPSQQMAAKSENGRQHVPRLVVSDCDLVGS
jgi:hypothetical protein